MDSRYAYGISKHCVTVLGVTGLGEKCELVAGPLGCKECKNKSYVTLEFVKRETYDVL